MTAYQAIAAKISEVLSAAQKCSADETTESYGVLEEQLQDLESAARRSARSDVDYRPLAEKLERGTPLSGSELDAVRSLIVGDADQYLKYCDNFEQTKGELRRILAEVRRLESRELDLETLSRLHVLCKEASSALAPTLHYLEQKERVRSFEEHTRDALSREAGQLLAGMIGEMVAD